MYLTNAQLQALFARLCARFERVCVLFDCYTAWGAKMSKIKNPVNGVGVTEVYGLETPQTVVGEGVVRELDMTPQTFIDELHGFEKHLFKRLYAEEFPRKYINYTNTNEFNENRFL